MRTQSVSTVSPWANMAILAALPLAWLLPALFVSPILGIAALIDIRFGSGRIGTGRALTAIALGLGGIVAVTSLGWKAWSVSRFVSEQPRTVLSAGNAEFAPDAFRAVFDVTDEVNDQDIAAFVSTLRSRYGRLLAIRPRDQVLALSKSVGFECEFEFELGVRSGRIGYAVAGETQSGRVPAVVLLAVLDETEGDVAFPPRYAQELEERRLRAFLRETNDRTRAVAACSYDAVGETYVNAGLAVTERGHVRVRTMEGSVEVAIDGHRQLTGNVPEIQFSVRANKDRESHWNRSQNDYAEFPPRVPGFLANGLLYLREFSHPTPFVDEANAREVIDEGHAEVGDVRCRVIMVKYHRVNQAARWYFGASDLLPRRVERYTVRERTRSLSPLLTLSVTNLIVNPSFGDDDFGIDPRPPGTPGG